MSAEDQKSRAREVAGSIARFSILATMLLILLVVVYFIAGLVSDGIDAQMIALDSYDEEKSRIWRTRY